MDTLVHTELPKQATQPGTQRQPTIANSLTYKVIIHGVASTLTDDEVQFATNALESRSCDTVTMRYRSRLSHFTNFGRKRHLAENCSYIYVSAIVI